MADTGTAICCSDNPPSVYDTVVRRSDTAYGGNDSCSDVTISTSDSISFFIERREKHHEQLNENVFIPITHLTLKFSPYEKRTLLSECYVDSYEDSEFYKEAIDHLKKDNPRFFDEKLELSRLINNYNPDKIRQSNHLCLQYQDNSNLNSLEGLPCKIHFLALVF